MRGWKKLGLGVNSPAEGLNEAAPGLKGDALACGVPDRGMLAPGMDGDDAADPGLTGVPLGSETAEEAGDLGVALLERTEGDRGGWAWVDELAERGGGGGAPAF